MARELFDARREAEGNGALDEPRRPRSPAARAMFQMAARRGIHGPYNIATHIRKKLGRAPTGASISMLFGGKYRKPSPEALEMFVEGFDLYPEEIWRLAYVVAFQREPPEELR